MTRSVSAQKRWPAVELERPGLSDSCPARSRPVLPRFPAAPLAGLSRRSAAHGVRRRDPSRERRVSR